MENKLNKVTTFSKILALILLISLPFIGYYIGFKFKNNISSLYLQCIHNKFPPITQGNTNADINTDSNLQTFRGTLKKEKIPVELDLGEYWYVFYFDSPYLLEENSAGRPMYIKQIIVNGPEDKFYDLNKFVDKQVEIKGTFGWGYAESTIINIVAIVEL